MKRRWFQIHLSTALILTLICAVFLGKNVIPHGDGTSGISSHEQWYWRREQNYGWPFIACKIQYTWSSEGSEFSDGKVTPDGEPPINKVRTLLWRWPFVLIDLATITVIALFVFVGFELRMRRREAHER